MNDLVTIVISCYNNEAYVRRCINSALAQTYSFLDIIIVDDGSTDKSADEISSFEDERIRVFTKENQGLSSSRQLGLENACGKYICFIDADDYLDRRYVEKLYNKISQENADICVCSTKFINEDLSVNSAYSDVFKYNNPVITRNITKNDLASEFGMISKQYYASDSWNKMYLLEFIKSSKIKFNMPKGLNGTDSMFNHMLLLHEPRISVETYSGYVHVLYNTSAVHRKNRNLQESYSIICNNLITECTSTGNEALLKYQIPNLYLAYLRNSFIDVINDNKENYDSQKSAMIEVMAMHKRFINANNIKIRINRTMSLSICFFSLAIKLDSVYLVWVHIKLRELLIGLHIKFKLVGGGST